MSEPEFCAMGGAHDFSTPVDEASMAGPVHEAAVQAFGLDPAHFAEAPILSIRHVLSVMCARCGVTREVAQPDGPRVEGVRILPGR